LKPRSQILRALVRELLQPKALVFLTQPLASPIWCWRQCVRFKF
jgi:hypothetical protein